MNKDTPTPALPESNISEIVFTIFRHKWKIFWICMLSIGAALCVPMIIPKEFQSEARLYIRYVVESQAPAQASGPDSRIRSPDARGESILNTELQIVTSWDLSQKVVAEIGADKILRKQNVPGAEVAAAAEIQKKLKANASRNSSVIELSFEHPDPVVAQSVLKSLIGFYLKTHAQIHAVGAFDEFLTQETDQRRSQVTQTGEELRKAKAKAGIISLDTSKQTYATQLARLQDQLFDTEAELADHKATLEVMKNFLQESLGGGPAQTTTTNLQEKVAPEKAEEYRRACSLLDTLYRREQDLLVTFTPTSSPVQEIRSRITAQEQQKRQLEQANPGLLALQITVTNGVNAARTEDPRTGIASQTARVHGLESRVATLKEQLEQVKTRASVLADGEGAISELQRRLQLQETNYTRFAQSLDQAQIDEKLGAGKVTNISEIQAPTPALPVAGKRIKIMAMIALGGIAGAFGFAFLIERYLDTTVKRPVEIQSKLGLSLFLSIPQLRIGGKRKGLKPPSAALLSERGTENGSESCEGEEAATKEPKEVSANGEITPWDPRHLLHPFSEALRDGLITFFEVNNLTHKPKLVAVTSCSHGAGVSTIASGLAASLSETGEGNVLLVDMNQRNGAVHQFYKGELACGLDDVLEHDKRDLARVNGNLYVATEQTTSDQVPVFLPKRFKDLVPRLRASDYDYIIFDMPPINQISPTQRLARFMDMVVMVVESEKTGREAARQAGALLTGSKTNVAAVLNKSKSYVPRWLQLGE